MLKKTRLVLIMGMALAALFLLPTVSFASPRTAATANTTTTVSLAFTGVISGTTTALTGGLTINVKDTGYFNGNLHEPDGTQASVSGKIHSDGSLNITFYTKDGVPFILGEAGAASNGLYKGPFQVYNGDKQIASGIWSALVVADPSKVLALAFTGSVGNTFLSGAIVLDGSTLAGTFNQPDGSILHVKANLLIDNKYAIKVNFGDGAIIGYGKPTDNPANGQDKGFKGPFYVTANGAKGQWVAYEFGF